MNTSDTSVGRCPKFVKWALLRMLPLLLPALLAACGGSGPAAGGGASGGATSNNPSPTVTALSQTSVNVGSAGLSLAITGSGFMSGSIAKWNGNARTTTLTSATQLTMAVTASDLSIAGTAQVSVSNPPPGGGVSNNLSLSITPRIANGIALAGSAGGLAIDATTDVQPVSAEAGDVQGGVIMTRLDVRFAKSATVGQVNAALANIAAGIVSMSKGLPAVTIGIPKQQSIADLQRLTAQLEASPGILLTNLASLMKADAIFNGSSGAAAQQIRHLIAARFPAAWNVARTDVFTDPSHPVAQICPVSPIPILMNDFFAAPPPAAFSSAFPTFEAPVAPNAGIDPDELQHGYVTTTVLGANAIGANPFLAGGCLDLHLIQAGAFYSPNQALDFLVFNMPPTDKFIVSFSLGFDRSTCELADCQTPRDKVMPPQERASVALHWKEKTRKLWPNFLMVVAAGNDHDEDGFGIWPGTGDSRFHSPAAIAQLSDDTFQFVLDDSQWTPSPALQSEGFQSLKPTAQQQANLVQAVDDAGLAESDATEDNIIVVGSTKSPDPTAILSQHITPDKLAQSDFSNLGPDIFAVGENVLTDGTDGTSFAVPQVSGLASFLWMVSPDLRDQPVALTKRAILTNANNKFLDAYATVLSLDAGGVLPTAQTAPIRRALLDVNGDGKFDENDLVIFLSHFQDANGNAVQPTAPDYSRFDLNGDGFTGGSNTERFDLDRVGSIQYGATSYSTVTQDIEKKTISFDETALNDLEILCYYAYSAMYTGDAAERAHLMAGCAGVTVTVTPGSASLPIGGRTSFSATVIGSSDPRVTWSVTGAGNIIGNDGVLTVGTTPGTFTVRATSIADPRGVGTATVTVTGQNTWASIFIQTVVVSGVPQLQATFQALDLSEIKFSSAIDDDAAFFARVDDLLSKTSEVTGEFGVGLSGVATPISLRINGPVGALDVTAAACTATSSITVSVGNVGSLENGSAGIRACGKVDATMGDVGANVILGATNGDIHVTAGSVHFGTVIGTTGQTVAPAASSHFSLRLSAPGGFEIGTTTDCTVSLQGNISGGLGIVGSQNLTLASSLSGGDLLALMITDTSFAGSSLDRIQVGDIGDGGVTITNNVGFTDQQAQAFANARQVTGPVKIFGNRAQ